MSYKDRDVPFMPDIKPTMPMEAMNTLRGLLELYEWEGVVGAIGIIEAQENAATTGIDQRFHAIQFTATHQAILFVNQALEVIAKARGIR